VHGTGSAAAPPAPLNGERIIRDAERPLSQTELANDRLWRNALIKTSHQSIGEGLP